MTKGRAVREVHICHAVLLAVFLYLGFFKSTSWLSFICSLVIATIWAEIWHDGSHLAFHIGRLHWIHREHHKSHLNSWLTAISCSFSEKLIFDLGFLGVLAGLDHWFSLNVFGIATWYIGYLVINSFSHGNFELKAQHYNRWLGKDITSTTYQSLHHSRYTGNYGLGTRVLDRIFQTEWEDYERLYDRISTEKRPLKRLSEKVQPVTSG
jgi:sterol desaturase/sphingolipid hydroxylase (fatty acid hydroxylase superfamily)